jgi:hypothetical protein
MSRDVTVKALVDSKQSERYAGTGCCFVRSGTAFALPEQYYVATRFCPFYSRRFSIKVILINLRLCVTRKLCGQRQGGWQPQKS